MGLARYLPRSALAALAAVVAVAGTAIPAAGAGAASCPQYNALFAAYGLPVATFSHIAYRESRCNPRAISRSGDYGLLQVNRIHLGRGGVAAGLSARALLDPVTNVAVAARLFHRAGLRPWRVH